MMMDGAKDLFPMLLYKGVSKRKLRKVFTTLISNRPQQNVSFIKNLSQTTKSNDTLYKLPKKSNLNLKDQFSSLKKPSASFREMIFKDRSFDHNTDGPIKHFLQLSPSSHAPNKHIHKILKPFHRVEQASNPSINEFRRNKATFKHLMRVKRQILENKRMRKDVSYTNIINDRKRNPMFSDDGLNNISTIKNDTRMKENRIQSVVNKASLKSIIQNATNAKGDNYLNSAEQKESGVGYETVWKRKPIQSSPLPSSTNENTSWNNYGKDEKEVEKSEITKFESDKLPTEKYDITTNQHSNINPQKMFYEPNTKRNIHVKPSEVINNDQECRMLMNTQRFVPIAHPNFVPGLTEVDLYTCSENAQLKPQDMNSIERNELKQKRPVDRYAMEIINKYRKSELQPRRSNSSLKFMSSSKQNPIKNVPLSDQKNILFHGSIKNYNEQTTPLKFTSEKIRDSAHELRKCKKTWRTKETLRSRNKTTKWLTKNHPFLSHGKRYESEPNSIYRDQNIERNTVINHEQNYIQSQMDLKNEYKTSKETLSNPFGYSSTDFFTKYNVNDATGRFNKMHNYRPENNRHEVSILISPKSSQLYNDRHNLTNMKHKHMYQNSIKDYYNKGPGYSSFIDSENDYARQSRSDAYDELVRKYKKKLNELDRNQIEYTYSNQFRMRKPHDNRQVQQCDSSTSINRSHPIRKLRSKIKIKYRMEVSHLPRKSVIKTQLSTKNRQITKPNFKRIPRLIRALEELKKINVESTSSDEKFKTANRKVQFNSFQNKNKEGTFLFTKCKLPRDLYRQCPLNSNGYSIYQDPLRKWFQKLCNTEETYSNIPQQAKDEDMSSKYELMANILPNRYFTNETDNLLHLSDKNEIDHSKQQN